MDRSYDPFRERARSGFGIWFRRILWGGLAASAAGLLLVAALFWHYSRGLPTVESLKDFRPRQTIKILDRQLRLLAQLSPERRTVVPLSKIPRVMVLSVLAAEDADFYQHLGLDYPGILRAVYKTLFARSSVQGASTITQQVVKNLLLTPERKLSRKVRELILARRLEQQLTKDEILHLYLNLINFGHGRYGVEEASLLYFDKHVEELTLGEAAALAGIPKAPARLSPLTHPVAAKRRQSFVLRQLARKRAQYWPDLALEDIEKAESVPLKTVESRGTNVVAPDVLGLVRSELKRHVGAEAVKRGGYTVYTSIDLEAQQHAREALQRGLEAYDRRHKLIGRLHSPSGGKRRGRGGELQTQRLYRGVITEVEEDRLTVDVSGQSVFASLQPLTRYNTRRLPASTFARKGAEVQVVAEQPIERGYLGHVVVGPEGAVVVLDPDTREVVALVGGYQRIAGFNRAWDALRQPGSAFKPVVYAKAIAKGRYTPASIAIDAPEVYENWKPKNYQKTEYKGAVRLRQALAQSINTVAVRLMEELTPQEVAHFAHSLGIQSELQPTLSLALGASEVRVVELTNAYATFLAGGVHLPFTLIRRITTHSGRDVYTRPPATTTQVMGEAEAYVMTDLLRGVVEEGTAKAALRLKVPAAGKTGTSNDARDAWFVGFTPAWVAGVWVGYDQRQPLGQGEGGSKTALPIWVDLMERLPTEGRAAFSVPDGVVHAQIDPETGLLAYADMPGAIDEVFVEGTVPTEVVDPPGMVGADEFLMQELAGDGAVEASPPRPPPQVQQEVP